MAADVVADIALADVVDDEKAPAAAGVDGGPQEQTHDFSEDVDGHEHTWGRISKLFLAPKFCKNSVSLRLYRTIKYNYNTTYL